MRSTNYIITLTVLREKKYCLNYGMIVVLFFKLRREKTEHISYFMYFGPINAGQAIKMYSFNYANIHFRRHFQSRRKTKETWVSKMVLHASPPLREAPLDSIPETDKKSDHNMAITPPCYYSNAYNTSCLNYHTFSASLFLHGLLLLAMWVSCYAISTVSYYLIITHYHSWSSYTYYYTSAALFL